MEKLREQKVKVDRPTVHTAVQEAENTANNNKTESSFVSISGEGIR